MSRWTPAEVDEYLKKHNVQGILSDAVNDAVLSQANDPIAHVLGYLGKLKGGAAAAADVLASTTVSTAPIDGQKPGTSGLRKKTKVFMEGNYLHNFVQSVFNSLVAESVPMVGGTLVVSGDGRFYNKEAIQIIIKMAVANGVGEIWLGTGGLLSTPAVSAVIRTRAPGFKPFGGFILSASHNPGGIDEDFGIKYNCENGGPAPEKLTNKMVEQTTSITEYKIANGFPTIDMSVPSENVYTGADGKSVKICVFDNAEDHVALLKECFDFPAIKQFVSREDFTMCYDSMNGVQGPYAVKVFCEELGLPTESLINAVPKEDFGGHESPSHGHADPNLTHAVELVAIMGLDKMGQVIETESPPPSFGAAADGDADRNMILGANFFVTPSDSLAIITANAQECIPFFKDGVKGCARSMPTSCALDKVAEKMGLKYFEVPTGWKFFGNLMDSGTPAFPNGETFTPFICGEESFGTGSNHVREKDGMWAVLAWLQMMAVKNPDPSAPLVGPGEICKEHWKQFGRNYYARYDYEGVDKPAAEAMIAKMRDEPQASGTAFGDFTLDKMDMFDYNDPVDGSVSKNQGIRIMFTDGSRIVFRLSGTGVAGATVRMYLEKYESPDGDLSLHAFDVVKPLADIALQISGLPEATGRDAPTVIT